ncbi:MAG: hypothetical protein PUB08_07625 [Firmicutes bacterium]|nr:hypothetical protein [Bacillota bacterium]
MGAYGSPELHPNLNNDNNYKLNHKMVECKKCHAQYSDVYTKCPQCGQKRFSSGKLAAIMIIICVISVGFVFFAFNNGLFDAYFLSNVDTDIENNTTQYSNSPERSNDIITTTTAQSGTTSPTNSFEAIYNEYATKLEAYTPIAIADFKAKVNENDSGLNGLYDTIEKHALKFTEIYNEGDKKIRDLYYNSGSGKVRDAQRYLDMLQTVKNNEYDRFSSECIAYLIS